MTDVHAWIGRPLVNNKVIVFAPHPDDETLGCGGTIAKKTKEGYEVSIVFLTDGRNAFLKLFGIDSKPTPEELREIRQEEAVRALRILGIPKDALLFLDFEDGTLERNEREVKKKIIEILSQSIPVEVYYPYEKDFNIDHRATSRIVTEVTKELSLTATRYRYSIMQTYARIGPIVDNLRSLFDHSMIRVDISSYLSLKEKALREFESQVSIISNRQQRPLIGNARLERFLRKEEIFFIRKNHDVSPDHVRKHKINLNM